MRFRTIAVLAATLAFGLVACTPAPEATTSPQSTSAAPAKPTTSWNGKNPKVEQQLTSMGFAVIPGSSDVGDSGAAFVRLDLGCPSGSSVMFFVIESITNITGLEAQVSITSPDGSHTLSGKHRFTTQPTAEDIQQKLLCGEPR